MSDYPNHIPEFIPPKMTYLPPGSLANVYQDWQAAVAHLDAGTPVVLSIAYDGWYADFSILLYISFVLTDNFSESESELSDISLPPQVLG